MTFSRFIVAILLLVTISFTTAFGNALTVGAGKSEFQHLRWKGQEIRITISNSLTRSSPNIKVDSDVMGALQRSVHAWSDVADIDIQVDASDKQSVSPAGVAGDGVSLITIAQTPENVLFFANDAESVSAKTRIFYNRRGMITEADIVLNPFQQFSTDGTFGTFDLESTLTHEIGHLLGLRHSAVMGSTMTESFARNGTRGIVDLSPRTLAKSDVSGIRDLYGPKAGDDQCCANISGKITVAAGKILPALRIWAEESSTGRVVAQGEAGADGTYRLGGLPAGDYRLYWKGLEGQSVNAFGPLGDVSVATLENKLFNPKPLLRTTDLSIQYLGLNGRLADFSVPLAGGRSYTLNVGGKDLGDAGIEFNTPYVSALTLPAVAQEFSEGIQGLTYFISVDRDIPTGEYTVILTQENGSKTCMIGGLSVE